MRALLDASQQDRATLLKATHKSASRRPYVVGPNAIIQTGEALRAVLGFPHQRDVFEKAGLSRYLDDPPSDMIPQAEAARLFAVIESELPTEKATVVFQDAGRRTGTYILANRIPNIAQRLIRSLPRSIAARVLLAAITKHAWTFAGSGEVTASYGRRLSISIRNNPLETPDASWHVAVFQRLFGKLVSTDISIDHHQVGSLPVRHSRFVIR